METTNNSELQEVNLLDILAEKTERKPEQTDIKTPENPGQPQENQQPTEEELNASFEETTAQGSTAQEDKRAITPKQNARMTVSFIDSLQTTIFSFLLRRKHKNNLSEKEQEIKKSISMKMQKDSSIEHYSFEEQGFIEKVARLDAKIKRLPFSKEEKDNLLPAAEAAAEYYQVQINPGFMFFGQLAASIGMRGYELYTE